MSLDPGLVAAGVGRSMRRACPIGMFALACVAGWTPAHAQVTLTEVNPTQSTLHASDPDGASGGRVNGLARASNSVFYAASEWGGLYKSTDTGRTWVRLDRHLPTATWDVEVSPADVNRVVATSFYDGRVTSRAGINVSTDAGATWAKPATATPPAGFCRSADRRDEPSAFGIAFDPANAKNVYAGTNCGLALSNDAGATWRFVDPTPNNGANDVWDVVVHHGGIIDVCGDDGHRRSTDGGATWTTAAAGGTPLPSGRCSIAASPDESHVLFAVVGTSIFETDNGGGTWNTSFVNPSAQGRIPFVAVNDRPGRAFDLWFGDVGMHRAGCQTPAPPAPGGAARCPASATWAGPFTRSAGAHDDTGDILFTRPTPVNTKLCLERCEAQRDVCLDLAGEQKAPTKAQCLARFKTCQATCNVPQEGCPVLMSSDGGIYFNTRTAAPACHTPAWNQPNVTPRGLWLFGMDGAHRAGVASEELYFGCQDNGSFATVNAPAAPPAWTNRDCCDGFDAAAGGGQVAYTICCFTPAPANRVFVRNAGMIGGGELNRYPGGNVPGFRFIDVLDRFGANSYVLVTTTGVFVTTNITASPVAWTQLGAATSPAGACGVKAAGPAAAPSFYVQAGACSGSAADRLFRYNGIAAGAAWVAVTPPPAAGAGAGFGVFDVDPGNANRLFASVVTAAGASMFRSTTGGAAWTADAVLDGLMTGGGAFRMRPVRGPVNFTGFGAYVQPTLVAFDPADANTMVAGASDAGVFLTRNGGTTWTVITNNAGTAANPHVPRPRFAYFDRECGDNNIYIGTQGRGVWRAKYSVVAPDVIKRCEADCVEFRNECMADAGRKGQPTKAQCQQAFNQCRTKCQCPS
jgi:photosystem II stability/assembly factor-like uncharacterized protein